VQNEPKYVSKATEKVVLIHPTRHGGGFLDVVVVNCSVWLMMKLDKTDLGLVLPKEFFQHYQQDKHQEERCSCHNRHAELGALSEYKYEISLSSIHGIQKTRSQPMTSNFSISLQFLLLHPLHQ
jgi:hypothetical protein